MTEQWRPVVGADGYEVSNLGQVRSLDKLVRVGHGAYRLRNGRVLKQTSGRHGHRYVGISQDGKVSTRLVHRMVLEAFVGSAPAGTEACHWNDDPSDNRLINLRWASHTDNMRDCLRNGNNRNASKTHCPRGHEYTPENIYRTPDGNGRSCWTCKRDRRRAYSARRSAVRRAQQIAKGANA